MPSYGFGHRPFGDEPFGEVDWCKVVLWEELPANIQEDDEANGFPFRNFIFSMCPNFEWLRHHIDRFRTLQDPARIRADLLKYLAESFGHTVDLAEPEDFQRIRTSLAAQWNIIKGQEESYVVLARTHGFELAVEPLWWNGTSFSTTNPYIANEITDYTRTVEDTSTRYVFWLECAPIEPGTFSFSVRDLNGNSVASVTENYPSGFISSPPATVDLDYGWGYVDILFSEIVTGTPFATYTSVVGGNIETCGKTKTHRIRLTITPGTIAGQSELTISEAFGRLFRKLDEARPIHVEFEFETLTATATLSIGYHFDVIPADETPLNSGMRWEISLTPGV